MIAISSDTTICRTSNHISTELDGELLLMDIENGKYFGLRGTASHIWSLIERPCTFSELCDRLQKQYKAPTGKIDVDAKNFIAQLIEHKLLTLS
jgi:hypothetical protein